HHRPLHPFPTRRSSDLTGRFLGFDPTRLPARARPNEKLVWSIIEWGAARGCRWLDVGGLDRADARALAAGVKPRGPHKNSKIGLDRKSTRLNSSHQIIS